MLGRILLAGAILLGGIAELQARTYYLPDYQSSFVYGGRTQKVDSTPQVSRTCSTFGYYSAADRPEYSDCKLVNAPIPGLVCYSCTACPSTYTYDSSNCSGEYVVSGESCGGRYTNCICDPSQYPGNSAGNGCAEGEKADLSQSCTNKSGGETFYKCVDDPCYDLISESTCSSSGKYCRSSSSCSGKCESCDVDTCSWAENLGYAECDNGCDTNGSIEGCSGRCKTGCKPITCPRGQKAEDGVCVDMSCSERLAADGYAVVTNYGEFYEAMKASKPAVIMNDIDVFEDNGEGGSYMDYAYPEVVTATASLYTPAYFKKKDNYYSSCQDVTPYINFDYSAYFKGAKEVYPNVGSAEALIYNDISFYGNVSHPMGDDVTVNAYGYIGEGASIQGTLNLYSPFTGGNYLDRSGVHNVYDDFIASDVYGPLNLHNPGKVSQMGILYSEANLDSGVTLKIDEWLAHSGTINMAPGSCLGTIDVGSKYQICAKTPVTISGSGYIVPLSCSNEGVTESDEDIGYALTCTGTVFSNCPEDTIPTRLEVEAENNEKLYGFIQEDGSVIYCPYMYTPKKPNVSTTSYTLLTEGDCYSARNNSTGALYNRSFRGIVCAKEKMTCEKQIMSKYPQAMIIKSEADLDEMMTDEKLSELSTNNQPAVLVNDITLSKDQTWKGYGSVKFVGATYFSDISECAEMEMPTVNLNGNIVKLGSELNMFNLHISGNSPSTDTITQIGSFDMSFQNGQMSNLSLEAESCYDLYWDGGENNWLKNVEMSNVDMYKVDVTLLWDSDGDVSGDYWTHKETMNETVSSDMICEYTSNSVSYPSYQPNTPKVCGWDSGYQAYLYEGTCTCNGVSKTTFGVGPDCWEAYADFTQSCRWSCI